MLSKEQQVNTHSTIDNIETYDLEQAYKEIKEKYETDYRILEERKKMKYKFPFSFRYRYQIKIEIIEKAKKVEKLEKTKKDLKKLKEEKKQSILQSLKNEKYSEKRFTIFEREEAIREYLMEQEIENRIIDRWFEEIKKDSKENLSEEQLVEKIKEKIKLTMNSKEKIILEGVCLFFGVTGIGKTTTIVKIAKKIEKIKKVGIITTDNYKMGAYHQMEQYSNKMKIPLMQSKINELELPINAFKYTKGIETILIDTAGRSPKHPAMKEEIENYIKEIKPNHNILVLSANQRYKDLQYTINVFKEAGITDFVVTKTDETNTYGFMVNIMDEYQKNILYVTNGQEVPNDIKEMDGEYWSNKIFENYKK
jgi:flagellar biosynthesis protein FlhF